MKTIGLFISSISGGGAERVFSRLSQELSKYYNVCVIVIDDRVVDYPVSGELINIGGNSKSYRIRAVNALLSINRIIKEKKIVCIISALDIPVIITAGFVKGCSRVISLRNIYGKNSNENGIRSTLKDLVRLVFFKKADKVVFVSKLQEYLMSEEFSIPHKRSCTIENLYNIHEIRELAEDYLPSSLSGFFRQYQVSVCVARLEIQKGFIYLLKAFERVVKKNNSAGLIILGEGRQADFLKKLIVKLGIDENVLFYGRTKAPFPIIKSSHLSIGTSLREGFPNALLESMCLGKPVMFTDCMTGPGEILRNEFQTTLTDCVEYADYGVLLPNLLGLSGNKLDKALDDIAEAWLRMLSDEELRRHYGEKARERAECFTYERCVNKYRELIEELT